MRLRGKNVLKATFKKYLSQARRLLKFFGLSPRLLVEWKESAVPFKRNPVLKPKREYCTLRWEEVRRICVQTQGEDSQNWDSILCRAILTMAFTTGARVGSLLPPKYGAGKDSHVPIRRANIRWVGEQCHMWQPRSKTDREGRGRVLIVSPTGCAACPVRALRRLLWCPADNENRLFSNGGGVATCDWFRVWLRW